MQVLKLDNGIRKKSNAMIFQGGNAEGFDPTLLDRITYLDYKVDLYHSDFAYLFYDSFVTYDYAELESVDAKITDRFTVISGSEDVDTQFISVNYELETEESRCKFNIKGENLDQVIYLLSLDDGNSFYQDIPINEEIDLPESTNQFRVGFLFPAGSEAEISDYGLYIGNQA